MAYRNYATGNGFIVAKDGNGDFSTIATALTAATSGDTIFIRPGTYTENPALVAGVNLTAFSGSGDTPTVTIVGECTFSSAGTVTISNIQLETNSNYLLAVTGSAASVVNLEYCYLNILNNTAIDYTSSSSSSAVNILSCQGNIATTGIAPFTMTSGGTLTFRYSRITNTGSSTTASTNSAGLVNSVASDLHFIISHSSTGGGTHFYSLFNGAVLNATAYALTGTSTVGLNYCALVGGTSSALSSAAGCTATIDNCIVYSSNTNAIAGAGNLTLGPVTFTNTSSTIQSTLTITSLITEIGTLNLENALTVANGGTGATTLTGLLTGNGTSAITGTAITQYNVITGGASNAPNSVAPSSTSGVPLISQGSSSQPIFGTAVVAGGGTGATTLTSDGVLYGNGTSAVGATTAATNGQVLLGATSAAPAFAALTSSAGSITYTTGANSLSLDVTNYSTGTFSPTMVGASTAGTTTYTAQNGYYIRYLNLVQIQAIVAGSAATGTGSVNYGALPFTVKNQTNGNAEGSILFFNARTWPSNETDIIFQAAADGTVATAAGQGSSHAAANVQMANISFNDQYTITYQV